VVPILLLAVLLQALAIVAIFSVLNSQKAKINELSLAKAQPKFDNRTGMPNASLIEQEISERREVFHQKHCFLLLFVKLIIFL